MEEKNIFLKVESDKTLLNYVSLYENFSEWEQLNNEVITDISITIDIEYDIEEQEEAGFVKCNFINAQFIDSEENLYDICNYKSESLKKMAEELSILPPNVKEDIIKYNKNILYIDAIYIEEKYRRIGIGSYILNNLPRILKYSLNIDANIIVLLPMPIEKRENLEVRKLQNQANLKENKKGLEKLYLKNHFKYIKDYMYKE